MSKPKKSTEVSVDSIKLTIGETEIELSIEQAKSLREALNSLWPAPHLQFPPGVRQLAPQFVPLQHPEPRPFNTDQTAPYQPQIHCQGGVKLEMISNGKTA